MNKNIYINNINQTNSNNILYNNISLKIRNMILEKFYYYFFSDLKKERIDNKKNNKLKLSPFNQMAVPIKYGE
jgi:hypothetical protein